MKIHVRMKFKVFVTAVKVDMIALPSLPELCYRYTLSALPFLTDATSGPLHFLKLCAHDVLYQGTCKA